MLSSLAHQFVSLETIWLAWLWHSFIQSRKEKTKLKDK